MHPIQKSAPLAVVIASCAGGGEDAPDLEASPGAVDFGEVMVQYSESRSVQLSNDGGEALEIEAILLEGVEAGVFTLTMPATPGEEVWEIQPGGSLELLVAFEPETYLEYAAELVITSNDPTDPELRVPLAGEGGDGEVPDIVVSPPSVDFGEVGVDGVPIELEIDVFNKGDGDLIIDSTTLSGSGAFSIAADLSDGATLGPDEDDQIEILYDPTTDLGDCATLTIHSNDPDQAAVQVRMQGNGGGECEYPVAVVDCPTDLLDPPTALTLDGSGSYDPMGLDLVTYSWSLLAQPDGSTAQIGDPNAPVTGLNIDAAGEWTVGLQVANEIELASTITECTFQSAPF